MWFGIDRNWVAEPSLLLEQNWDGKRNHVGEASRLQWNVQEESQPQQVRVGGGLLLKHRWDTLLGLPDKLEDIEGTECPMEQARLESEKPFLVTLYLDTISGIWLLWPEEQEWELSPADEPCSFSMAQAKLHCPLFLICLNLPCRVSFSFLVLNSSIVYSP